MLNPSYSEWTKSAYTQAEASKHVYANIHDKVKACDVALGYNIRPLMPPAPILATQPAVNLSSYDVAKVKAMDCQGLKTFVKTWVDEVVYVRSERIRHGNASIMSKQVTFGQISDMGQALEKRANSLKCELGNVLPATMSAGFDFPQKLGQ